MTDFHSDSSISSDETIYSDEDFIDDSENETEDEYIPEYNRQKLVSCEHEQKVEIKFVNGKWILNVINVPVSSNQ